jgi:SAM-dependent methyltransferase
MSDGTATFRTTAQAYDRHIGRYGPELARAFCDAAGVRRGQDALDVGCGPGALTAELVARLRADHVVAVEPSRTFAQGCRRRLPGVTVHDAPAERLPLPDAAVDVALAQLVLNFLADAPRGVAEMARVTRRRGTVGAAVWDYAGEMTLLRSFWDAATHLDPAARAHDEGLTMPLCHPDALRQLWTDAGLTTVSVTAAHPSAHYAGFDDLWSGLTAGVGPSGAYAVALGPDHRHALADELRRRLPEASGEPFRLTARAWIVIGQRR